MTNRLIALFIISVLVAFILGYTVATKIPRISKLEAAIKSAEQEIANMHQLNGYRYEIEYVIRGNKLFARSLPKSTPLPDESLVFGGGGEVTVDLETGTIIERRYYQ